MKELSLKDQHILLLGIAKEFDKVCRDSRIPYYMLGGTMLGAIRHKGFIPWDDDMDFGVPRPYYERLISALEEQLPVRYRCCTYDNSRNIIYPFIKIEDTHTKCHNGQYQGTIDDYLGINIDVFPLDYCELSDREIKRLIWLNDKYGRVFTGSASGSALKLVLKRFIRLCIPFSQDQCYRYIEKKMLSIHNGNYIGNLLGHWEEKEIVPQQWYGLGFYYDFEGLQLMGLKEYDKYLTRMYGDYMRLPPMEKRVCHADGVFLMKE